MDEKCIKISYETIFTVFEHTSTNQQALAEVFTTLFPIIRHNAGVGWRNPIKVLRLITAIPTVEERVVYIFALCRCDFPTANVGNYDRTRRSVVASQRGAKCEPRFRCGRSQGRPGNRRPDFSPIFFSHSIVTSPLHLRDMDSTQLLHVFFFSACRTQGSRVSLRGQCAKRSTQTSCLSCKKTK